MKKQPRRTGYYPEANQRVAQMTQEIWD